MHPSREWTAKLAKLLGLQGFHAQILWFSAAFLVFLQAF
jgi:hypothetical protein